MPRALTRVNTVSVIVHLKKKRGRGGVILNPSAMQNSFKIFDRSFEKLKNVCKILHLVELIHSGYLINYFHIDMELELFGEVSFLNIKSENDEI